jgi:hypothetical protein
MAPTRGLRGGLALAIILVSCVEFPFKGGSQQSPGHGDAESDMLPCKQGGCRGTMQQEDGYYVCDTNSAHWLLAEQPCTQPSCHGTLRLRESGYYVCDTDSAHKLSAELTADK